MWRTWTFFQHILTKYVKFFLRFVQSRTIVGIMIVLDKSTGVRTLNELQLLDLKIGHQDKSPNHGRQGDVAYWFAPPY